MAEPYLTELKVLVARACGPAAELITTKHFFSGAAAYVDGQIFMSLSPVGLALKLPEDDCLALFEAGGQPLRYFPKAPVKKGYVVLPDHLVADEQALRQWISRGRAYVQSM